jgi:hypothetical protein
MKFIISIFLFFISFNNSIHNDNFNQKNISFEIIINSNTTIHYDNITKINITNEPLNDTLIEGLNHTNKTVLEGIGQLIKIRENNPFSFPSINVLQMNQNFEEKNYKKLNFMLLMYVIGIIFLILSIIVFLEYNNKIIFRKYKEIYYEI